MLTDQERQIEGILLIIGSLSILIGIVLSVLLAAMYHRAVGYSPGMHRHQWAEGFMALAWGAAIYSVLPFESLLGWPEPDQFQRSIIFMCAIGWKLISQIFRDNAWYSMWHEIAKWRGLTIRSAVLDLIRRR